MTQHELTGLLIIAGIVIVALVLFLVITGWHPYVYIVHRRQVRALRGQWRPPERSRFWVAFYSVMGVATIFAAFWLVFEALATAAGHGNPSGLGFSLFFTMFLPVNLVSVIVVQNLIRSWEADTMKWKCGTWRGLPVKELHATRVHDVITLEYEVTNKDAAGVMAREVVTHTTMYEAGRTGGISPRTHSGISTRNKGAIIIAKFRKLTEERMKMIMEKVWGERREEVPFASGFALGDIYFTPGDPVLFLFGFDRSMDPENPTPDPIREFIIRHPQTFGDVKPMTEILFVPDLYPDFEDRMMAPAQRPTDMEFLLEYLARLAGKRGGQALKESKFDRGLDSIRAKAMRPYDLEESER